MTVWQTYLSGRSRSVAATKIHGMKDVQYGDQVVHVALCGVSNISTTPLTWDGDAPDACQRCARLRGIEES